MRILHSFAKIFLLFSLFVWLTACGGGGGGGSGGGNDNPCGTVVDIGPNSIVDGKLEAGDCRLIDIDPTSGGTSFIDEYRITLNALDTLTINMRSSNLNTYLYLADRSTSCSNGCTTSIIIAFDDNSGGGVNGTDALISMGLTPGTYLIGANSFDPQTGSYTLETHAPNLPDSYITGQIGPAGGIVFYVTDGGLHGLEAAPVDQSATATWGCFGKDIAGADGPTIGAGDQNTADILVDCAALGIAARLADNYSLNGFNDWFLPSQDELNELYLQRAIVGGFTAIDSYWSSTEQSSSAAWVQSFKNGNKSNLDKRENTFTGTRAVRAF
jgi:hypothetical protein